MEKETGLWKWPYIIKGSLSALHGIDLSAQKTESFEVLEMGESVIKH